MRDFPLGQVAWNPITFTQEITMLALRYLGWKILDLFRPPPNGGSEDSECFDLSKGERSEADQRSPRRDAGVQPRLRGASTADIQAKESLASLPV